MRHAGFLGIARHHLVGSAHVVERAGAQRFHGGLGIGLGLLAARGDLLFDLAALGHQRFPLVGLLLCSAGHVLQCGAQVVQRHRRVVGR
ncbi:MAG TPA: hypothetical protein VN019_06085, partial [Oxalicibacterium sp.]|nr:hypothetical protein [Oxalicibacterium sp.]